MGGDFWRRGIHVFERLQRPKYQEVVWPFLYGGYL
jgi:hypothetical protein